MPNEAGLSPQLVLDRRAADGARRVRVRAGLAGEGDVMDFDAYSATESRAWEDGYREGLEDARAAVGAMVKKGDLPAHEHEQRNGLVLAWNAISTMIQRQEDSKQSR